MIVNDTINNEEMVSDTPAPSSSNVGITHEVINELILVIENDPHEETAVLVDKKDTSVVFDLL